MKKAHLILSGILLLLLIETSYSTESVIIEFLFFDPDPRDMSCPACKEVREDFSSKNEALNRIENEYGNQVLIERIEYFSPEGQEKAKLYNVTLYNSILINGEIVVSLEEDFNEMYMRQVIDVALGKTPQSSPAEPSDDFRVLIYALAIPTILLTVTMIYFVRRKPKAKQETKKIGSIGTKF